MIKKGIEWFIFQSRWLLVPFYVGLVIAQAIYCYKFGVSLLELCHDFRTFTETQLMMSILTLIDITMIANLIKMIIAGSYQSFVEKISFDHLEKASSGVLKIKMGGSLIGVSSIHLLQSFINTSDVTTRDLVARIAIHLVFLMSTMGLAYIEYLHDMSKIAHAEVNNE